MNNITELVFIVDCSRAMADKEFETVSSINSILDSYRNLGKTVYVNTFTFNETVERVHDRLKIEAVKSLTIFDLKKGGNAALYDTIAAVVNHLRNIHHYIRPEDVPHKTIFHIYSFGLENASTKYSRTDVKEILEQQKKTSRWEFYCENENIYTAQKELILPSQTITESSSPISDSDFEILMKILGKSSKNMFI